MHSGCCGICTFENSFCFRYTDAGNTQTAFRADGKFNSSITSFSVGFKTQAKNTVLSVSETGGSGSIQNFDVNIDDVDSRSYLAYVEDGNFIMRVFGFFVLFFEYLFK